MDSREYCSRVCQKGEEGGTEIVGLISVYGESRAVFASLGADNPNLFSPAVCASEKTHQKSPEGRQIAVPPGAFGYAMSSINRVRMVATWARVASPWGLRVVAVVPVRMPWPTAQAMACWA